MNRAYRLVWSAARNAWVAVCEFARAHGKGGRSAVVALLSPALAWALPEGGQIVGGSGVISQSGSAMTVQQDTARMAVDWQKFGISASELVRFNQPSSSAIALNRVLGNSPSAIFGQLQANGQIFLVNPNGILFAPGSRVDVGGLVASTLSMNPDDFMAGRHTFRNNGGAGSVVNQGALSAANGGYIALLAPEVRNEGVITARQGTVVMAAGDAISLSMNNNLVSVQVDEAALSASIINRNAVLADDGSVVLSARARDALLNTVINNEGLIEARRVTNRGGVILLDGGDSGVVRVAGALDASGLDAGQTGGRVEILGEKVLLTGDARVNVSGDQGAGTILVGGDYQGRGSTPTAAATYIASGAQLVADAVTRGDGGKVIVWADDTTRYYGEISARGGAAGGDGGFVEVSGKKNLDFSGAVDLAAPMGRGGTILLDPTDITLQTAAGNYTVVDQGAGTADVAFATTPATMLIQISQITGLSEAYLQASNNITVANTVNMANGSSIRLLANNSIRVNASITTNGNGSVAPGSINLTASGGTLYLNAALRTNGGDVLLTGGTVTATNAGTITTTGCSSAAFARAGGNVVVNATASNGALGDITLKTITTTGGVTTTANLSGTNAGNVTLTGRNVSTTNILTDGYQAASAKANDATGVGVHGGDAGNISINASGNVTVAGYLCATGGAGVWNASWNAANPDVSRGGSGGAVNITSSGGSINVTGAITARNAAGSNAVNTAAPGQVNLRSDAGDVAVGGVITTTPRTAVTASSSSMGAGAAAGNVTITALQGNISTVSIQTGNQNTLIGGQDGGHITLKTGNAARDQLGLSNAVSYTGGNINVTGNLSTIGAAANTLQNNATYGAMASLTRGGSGGNVDINASNGSVNVTGSSTTVIATTGGQANLNTSANVLSSAGGSGGNVAIAGTGVSLGSALVVCTTANQTYTVIEASGRNAKNALGGAGGTVTIDAGAGAANLLANNSLNGTTANAAGTRFTTYVVVANAGRSDGAGIASASAGNVSVAGASVRVPHVITSGQAGYNNSAGGSGGAITLNATSGNVTLSGNLTAAGGNLQGAGASGAGGAVTLAASDGIVVQNAGAAGLAINVLGGNNHTGGNVTLTGALYESSGGAASKLTINASNASVVTLNGGTPGDATAALTTLAVNATGSGGAANGSATGKILVGDVKTKGAQTYDAGSVGQGGVRIGLQGNVTTYGTAGADTVTFSDPITLLGHSSITTGASSNDATDLITLNQTINGNKNLAVNAGLNAAVIVSAALGQSTALGAFNATGKSVTYSSAVNAESLFGRATGGNVTLNGSAALTATGAGRALELAASQDFNNSVGASALNTPAGSFLVWSSAPITGTINGASYATATTTGGVAYAFKQYNATYGATTAADANTSHSGFLYSAAPVITGVLASVTKVYDGTTVAMLTPSDFSGISGTLAGDTLGATPTTGVYDSKNVGTGNRSVSVTGTFNNVTNGSATVYGYQINVSGSGNSSITPANLTVSGLSAQDKVYDGSTVAALSANNPALQGVYGADVVSLVTSGAVGAFADPAVGSAKAVSVSGLSIGGADAANYLVNSPNLSASILAAPAPAAPVTPATPATPATTPVSTAPAVTTVATVPATAASPNAGMVLISWPGSASVPVSVVVRAPSSPANTLPSAASGVVERGGQVEIVGTQEKQLGEATEELAEKMSGGQIGIIQCGIAGGPSGLAADKRCQSVLP
ncbi:MAG: filamentous hemagglutinin N-terminal domain-containing protein [Betaproteobacteria bacterium]|nr:filamentous hemagglutinin N-terminal domain-containing protein [Betaproteobacteria bacterium]